MAFGGTRKIRRRNVTLKKRSASAPLRKPVAKAVARIAKRVVSRRLEDKHAVFQVVDNPFNSAITLPGDAQPVVKAIPQGSGEANRQGDQIKPKYLKVTGVVTLDPPPGYGPTDPQNNPLMVRIMCVSQNNIKYGDTSTLNFVSLLRDTGGAVHAFNGQRTDCLLPINTDLFRVYFDRKVVLRPVVEATTESTNKSTYMYSFKIKCPAHFKFDSSIGDYPNNWAAFMLCGYAYMNGAPPDAVKQVIHHSVRSHLIYEDA